MDESPVVHRTLARTCLADRAAACQGSEAEERRPYQEAGMEDRPGEGMAVRRVASGACRWAPGGREAWEVHLYHQRLGELEIIVSGEVKPGRKIQCDSRGMPCGNCPGGAPGMPGNGGGGPIHRQLFISNTASPGYRIHTAWEGERRREAVTRLVLGQHGIRVGLALGGVGRGDGVDDGLGLLVANLCSEEGLCQHKSAPC